MCANLPFVPRTFVVANRTHWKPNPRLWLLPRLWPKILLCKWLPPQPTRLTNSIRASLS